MAFYRTHRPQHFRDVLGQPTATQTLQGALRKQRIGHAYLLTGPRGTGKTSTARIFARAACCLDVQTADMAPEPCDHCANCLALLEGSSSDFLEIDAASNRGIEDVRDLRENAAYPPTQLPYRIFIIDEVHMLTVEAFNALLKLLEEPPAHCIFLLATTELQKVPLTIRSRCQTVSFRSADPEQLVTKLSKVAKAEKIAIDRKALQLLATHAEGGFRDAETLLEQLANGHEEISEETVQDVFGLLPSEQISHIIAATLSGNATKLREVLAAIPVERTINIRQLLDEVRRQLYDEKTPTRQMPRLQLVFEKFLEAYILQKSAPTPRLSLEVACFSLCQPTTEPEVVALPKPIEQKVAPILHIAPVETSPRVPIIELHQEPSTDIRKAWKQMTEQICRENMVLGGTLKQTVLHTSSNGQIIIHVRFKFHADKFNEKRNRELILSILQNLTGQNWDIVYEVNANLPKRSTAKQLGTASEDAVAVFGEVG